MKTKDLLNRLDEIGRSLERSGHALALIGLGSVGVELDRVDSFSDLDFFVIVEEGYKRAYLDSLKWLSDIHPVAFSFLNTEDGYKLLFEDGIFCEFAVFAPDELKNIPFAPGRIVWKRDPKLVNGFVPTDLWRYVRRIASPTIYILGGKSRIVPAETQDQLKQALPHIEIVTMPGLGHYPDIEAPEDFLAIVDRFLSARSEARRSVPNIDRPALPVPVMPAPA